MGRFLVLIISIYWLACPNPLAAEPVAVNARCTVCGMFVAKYDAWIATIHDEKADKTFFFDGVKDMMVFFFDPGSYGGGEKVDPAVMQVKDYYSLEWIYAGKAYYVVGSDVYGPMGHEFIPFSAKKAAEAFLKDHQGKRIITFSDITSEMVNAMRSGQRMR